MFTDKSNEFWNMSDLELREYFVEYFYDIFIRKRPTPIVGNIASIAYQCGFITSGTPRDSPVPKFDMDTYVQALKDGDHAAWAKLLTYSKDIIMCDSESKDRFKTIFVLEEFWKISPFKDKTIMKIGLNGSVQVTLFDRNSEAYNVIKERFNSTNITTFVAIPEINWSEADIIEVKNR